jgi:hypothetical protein
MVHCGRLESWLTLGCREGVPGTGVYAPTGLLWDSHRGLAQHLKKRMCLGSVWY